MKRTVLLISAALLLATAADASIIGQRSVELTAAGGFQHQSFSDDLGSFTTLQLSGSMFYAFTSLLQGGFGLFVMSESVEGSSGDSISASSFGFDGALRFNFGDSETVVPYIQGGVGFILYSGDIYDDASTTLQPGATLGLRLMANDAASFNIGLSYLREINALGSDQIDANTFLLSLGLSVFPQGLNPD